MIEPMLPYAGVTLPEREENWAFEVKYDGFRAIVFCEPDQVRIQSRNLKWMTLFYPELQALSGRRMVLDGELVAFDSEGRQCFEMMQHRAGVIPEVGIFRRPPPGRKIMEPSVPITYQVFDLLSLDGECLMGRPYRERRAVLEDLNLNGSHWFTPENHVGVGARALLEASRNAGLEGLVAKRLDSTYQPGRRTPDWQKFKNWCRQDFVVGGWRPDASGWGGWLGALLLGYYDEGGELRYAGALELGFKDDHLDILRELLPSLECRECPFVGRTSKRAYKHLDPALIVEVQFLGWTSSGKVRQASFKGFVVDRPCRQVQRDYSLI